MHLLIWLIVGGIAGFLAGKVVRGRGFGVIVDIILGIIGSFVGGYLLHDLLKTSVLVVGGHNVDHFITAFIGAVVIVALVRLIRR